jgi:predicted metal-dependent enzyme (double-stranded beta helix superfamily)
MVSRLITLLDTHFLKSKSNKLEFNLKECQSYVNQISHFEFLDYIRKSNLKKTNDVIVEDVKTEIKKINRTKLHETKDYEIILISWAPGAKSHIHNHPVNGCIYKILDGILIEETYDPKTIELTNLITLLPNDIGYIDNTICYHKIYNPEPFQAYSLHIYSPPNFNMSIY